jgi:hypothetical protein
MTNVSPRQKKHVLRLMEDALDSTKSDKDDIQRLADRGGDFKADLVTLIGRYTAKVPDYALVREILGDDFISPEEIAAARGLAYTDDQIAELESALPDRETLEWLRRNDFMLVAGSPRDMSLLDIRELERSYFYSKEGGWYSKSKETFARNDKVTCRWLMLRKGIVPNSTSKTWGEQEKLLSDLEVVPNAAEQVWGMTVYKAVRGVYLLGNVYARTSSVGSDGDRVDVGGFDGHGLDVRSWNDSARNSIIGVASSRK